MVPGRKAALAASGEGECKFGACPACRFDIFLLVVGTCRIEKKRASKACPDFVFRFSADKRRPSPKSAEKKIVFSAE